MSCTLDGQRAMLGGALTQRDPRGRQWPLMDREQARSAIAAAIGRAANMFKYRSTLYRRLFVPVDLVPKPQFFGAYPCRKRPPPKPDLVWYQPAAAQRPVVVHDTESSPTPGP